MSVDAQLQLEAEICKAEAAAFDLENRATILRNCQSFVEQQERLGAYATVKLRGDTLCVNVYFNGASIENEPADAPVLPDDVFIDGDTDVKSSGEPFEISIVPKDEPEVSGVDLAKEPDTSPIHEREFKTGDFSDEEVDTILAMNSCDAGSGEIAAALGRDPRGFYHKVRKIVAAASKPLTMPPDDTPEFPPAPAPKPVAKTARPNPVPEGEAPPFTDNAADSAMRRLHYRLDQIPQDDTFNATFDYHLVLRLSEGAKLRVIAGDLGLPVEDLKKRFALLVPHPSMEEQAAVLKALKERVPEEVAL